MKEEIINERLRFKSFTNDILTEGLRVVIAMVSIFVFETLLTPSIIETPIAFSRKLYIYITSLKRQ